MRRAFGLFLLGAALLSAQPTPPSTAVTTCVGSPGATRAPYRGQCQAPSGGALYTCANTAGCALPADWQLIGPGAGGPPTGAANGDLSGSYPNPGVSQVNGHTPGGTCSAGQTVTSVDSSGRPTCSQPAGYTANATDPATCTPGVTVDNYNTTAGVWKYCSATNTWSAGRSVAGSLSIGNTVLSPTYGITAPGLAGSITFAATGDSVTSGYGLAKSADNNSGCITSLADATCQDWPSQLALMSAMKGKIGSKNNKAHSGNSAAQLLALYTAEIHPLSPVVTGNPGILIYGGDNETTYASEISTLTTYWAGAKADGWTLVVATQGPRSSYNATTEAARQQINTWIRSHQTLYDKLLDFDLLLSDNSDQTWFQYDDTHPTAAGAVAIARAANGLLWYDGAAWPITTAPVLHGASRIEGQEVSSNQRPTIFVPSQIYGASTAKRITQGSEVIFDDTVLGAELATSDSSCTGWTLGSGWTCSSGVITHTSGTATATYAAVFPAGAILHLSLPLTGVSLGNLTPSVGAIAGPATQYGITFAFNFLTSTTDVLTLTPTTTWNGSVNVTTLSLKQVLGGTVTAGNGLDGHASCWKGQTLSYCTTAVGSNGTCTCH